MSTRSLIIRQNPDGTLTGVNCEEDGYLTGVGQTLYDDYQSPQKIQKLYDRRSDISQLTEYVSDEYQDCPVQDEYGDHFKQSSRFHRLPKAERDRLTKIADRFYTTFLAVPNGADCLLHWKSVDDLVQSIKDKEDSRVDTVFVEYIYLYTNRGTWKFFYDIESGLHPKQSLFRSVQHARSLKRQADALHQKEERQRENWNSLYNPACQNF